MQKAFELTLMKRGLNVPVFALEHINQKTLEKVQTCKKFKDYIDRIDITDKDVAVDKIEILGVEMFGEKVGFVNLRAITKKDGFSLPSYVFLRGPAVAILLIVNDKILLVEQYRVPVQETLLETPAGMLDQSGDFAGTAALEIQEETSIKIKHQDLHSLGSMYPSPGGCDEEIKMFYTKVQIGEAELKQIESKIHGKEGESEKIKVKLIEFNTQEILKTRDAKLISLVLAYQGMQGNEAKL